MMKTGKVLLRATQQKVGFQSKTPMYVTRAQAYSSIGEDDVIQLMAEDSGITKSQAAMAAEALKTQFIQMMLRGHSLQLGDLGYVRISISAKSVKNKENVSTSLIRGVRILFRPSVQMKQHLQNIGFEISDVVDYVEPQP